jgi:hypothetical protein
VRGVRRAVDISESRKGLLRQGRVGAPVALPAVPRSPTPGETLAHDQVTDRTGGTAATELAAIVEDVVATATARHLPRYLSQMGLA